jgi:hypothetical protein
LELIARDPKQEALHGFGQLLRDLEDPTLLTWAAACEDIEAVARVAQKRGWILDGPRPMRRRCLDGSELSWRILLLSGHRLGLCLPFFIQWDSLAESDTGGSTNHPSRQAPHGCTLESFTLHHPQPKDLEEALCLLGLEIQIASAPQSHLTATLMTPKGRLLLS